MGKSIRADKRDSYSDNAKKASFKKGKIKRSNMRQSENVFLGRAEYKAQFERD